MARRELTQQIGGSCSSQGSPQRWPSHPGSDAASSSEPASLHKFSVLRSQNPILISLLMGSPPPQHRSPGGDAGAHVDLGDSRLRHDGSQHVKRSRAASNREQTRAQTHSPEASVSLRQPPPPSVHTYLTDKQIQNFIAQKVAYFKRRCSADKDGRGGADRGPCYQDANANRHKTVVSEQRHRREEVVAQSRHSVSNQSARSAPTGGGEELCGVGPDRRGPPPHNSRHGSKMAQDDAPHTSSHPLRDPRYEDISDDEDACRSDPRRPQTTGRQGDGGEQNPPDAPVAKLVDEQETASAQAAEETIPDRLDPRKHVLKKIQSRRVSADGGGARQPRPPSEDRGECYIVTTSGTSGVGHEPRDQGADGAGADAPRHGDDKQRRSSGGTGGCVSRPPPATPAAAAVPRPLEVFDTPESFLQARRIRFEASDKETRAFETDSDEETEDSCTYSSASEHNYMTVSRHLLVKQHPALSSEEGGGVESEDETRQKEDVSSGSTPVDVQSITDSDSQKEDETIDLVTDTDGDGEDDVHGTRSDGRRRGVGRSEESVQTRKRSPADSPGPQSPPRDETEEGTDRRGQLVSQCVIDLDSDTDDEWEQTCRKRSLIMSSSSDTDDGPPPRPRTVSADGWPGSGKETSAEAKRPPVAGRGPAEHNGRKTAGSEKRRFQRRIISSESEDTDDGNGVCGDKTPFPKAGTKRRKEDTGYLCSDDKGRFVSSPNTTRSSSSHKRPHSDSPSSRHSTPPKRPPPPSRSRSSSFDQRLKGPSSPTAPRSSARRQVNKDWNSSFVPFKCRWRRRHAEDPKGASSDAQKDARAKASRRGGGPRRQHNSLDSATPLMKKSMCEAKQHTKARLCEAPREPRCSVGEGYKWSEKHPSHDKAKYKGSSKRKNR